MDWRKRTLECTKYRLRVCYDGINESYIIFTAKSNELSISKALAVNIDNFELQDSITTKIQRRDIKDTPYTIV